MLSVGFEMQICLLQLKLKQIVYSVDTLRFYLHLMEYNDILYKNDSERMNPADFH